MDKPILNELPLLQLQQWVQQALMQEAPAATQTESLICSSSRLSAARHLDIYRHSYIARLRECMRLQFGALAHALGQELFELFADQYLAACPSESYTLNELGRHFPDFLEEHRPDAEQREDWPDFMIGLARFEYALSELFDAHAPEDGTPAGEATPDELLELAPVFRLFQHAHPICAYYLAFSRGEAPELPLPEETWCAVTRLNYRLGLHQLRPAQHHFLLFLQETGSIAQAKERMQTELGVAASELGRIWPAWKQFFTASGFFRERSSAL